MTNIENTVSSLSTLLNRIAKQNLNQAATKAPEAQTKKSRLESWKTSRKNMTRARVSQLTELFSSIPTLFGRTTLEEPRLLTASEIDNLVEERLAADEVELAVKAWKENQKADIIAHLNVLNDWDEDLPDRSLVSAKFGKRLVLEGGARKAPQLDPELLRELLGEDRWEKVTNVVKHPRRVVEAWEEQVIDDALVTALIQEDHEVLDIVSQALIIGDKTSPRLNWRNIEGKEAVL